MNGRSENELIPEGALFVEDPTNFDVTLNPKTGLVKHSFSFGKGHKSDRSAGRLERVAFLDKLQSIVEDEPDDGINRVTFEENENDNRPAYKRSSTFYDQD